MTDEHVEFDVTVNPFTGVKLPTVLKASYDVKLYESKEEIPSGKLLNDDQYVKAVNAREKANLRAKATTKACNDAGIKRPESKSPEMIAIEQRKLFGKMYPNATDEQINNMIAAQAKFAESLLPAAV